MIGGSPIFSAPVMPAYPQGYAPQAQGYPQPYAGQQPYPQGYAAQPAYPQAYPAQQPGAANWSGQPQAWTQPAPASAVAATTPAPKFRMQMAEETPAPAPPRPAFVRMPTPTELGVTEAPAQGGAPPWTKVHQRLEQLGASSYHLDRLPQGGYRFTCFLPTHQTDTAHRIQADAASEGQAISLVLDKAEEWAQTK